MSEPLILTGPAPGCFSAVAPGDRINIPDGQHTRQYIITAITSPTTLTLKPSTWWRRALWWARKRLPWPKKRP